MHASIEELLSLRDDDGADAAVAAHVAGCAHCRVQLEDLRRTRAALGALPMEHPDPAAWNRIVRRAVSVPARRRAWPRALGSGIAAAIALLALLWMRPQAPAPEVVAAQPAVQRPVPAAPGADMRALIERSQQLEATLAALRFEPRVVQAGTAATIDTLEDHLAVVDYRLSLSGVEPLGPEDSRRLWQQRVDLMDSLVNVRYAQLQRVAY